MVPEEQSVLQWNLLGSFQNQLRHLFKMTTEGLDVKHTYLLPIGNFLGLIS